MRPVLAPVLAAATAAAIAADRWARRTRATDSERRRALPGDDLVPAPLWQATRATSIDAPPEAVWPWLVQMGYPAHRAGWYTPYWLDRLVFGIRVRSADRIVGELQHLAVGDRVLDSPRGDAWFSAAVVEPPHALVLHSHTHPLPLYRDTNFSWAFVCEPRPAGGSRLIMRARIAYVPRGPARVVRALIAAGFGVGDVLQAGGMLGGIRARAERLSRPSATPPPAPPSAPRFAAAHASGAPRPAGS